MKPQFQCCCEVTTKVKKRTGRFYIVKVRSSPTSFSFLKAAFLGVFSDTPRLCTKTKVTRVSAEATSAVAYDYAMYNTVNAELDRLEKANIITPVHFSE